MHEVQPTATEKNELLHVPVLPGIDFGLFRVGGPGLGNILFPIARALIACHKQGGLFVFPTIPQIKVGPIIRRERDKRLYFTETRRRSLQELHYWLKSIRADRTPEGEERSAPNRVQAIVYEGMREWFNNIANEQEVIRSWLDSNAKYAGRIIEPYDIGVHVRLGDFVDKHRITGATSIRNSSDWYKQAILRAREHAVNPSSARVVIFSDENPDVVRKMLGLPSALIDPSRNAITAIRNLSDAGCIVTSRSTFSMWGVFLNNRPAIWHKDLSLATYFPSRGKLDQVM